MKIIYVIESLSRKGGAENALVNLCIELVKMGHEPSIVHLWSPNDFHSELDACNIQTYSLDLSSRWNLLQGIIRFQRILQRSDAKIINALNFFPMMYVALSKMFSNKKKRIVTYHNMGYEVYPASNPIKIIRKYIDILLNKLFFDGFLGVSNAVSLSYEKHLRIKKIDTIENIIPIDSIIANINPTMHLPNEEGFFKIIMAGRLVHEKGYQYMLEALKILKTSNLKFHLKIFGDGVLRSYLLEEIKQKDLAKEITISPTVNHNNLFREIYRADIFVMSSVSEGFPMAPAEAMVLGVPVIATSVGGIPELIEDGVSGVLVPPKNAKMLAEAIKTVLLDKNLRDSLSVNGQKRINENFSPKIICQKLLDYYKEVLES
tara:strand:+ start:28629 stop:29753 length:1125 start_codon:yes stop_codon:yes gene_type:complete